MKCNIRLISVDVKDIKTTRLSTVQPSWQDWGFVESDI